MLTFTIEHNKVKVTTNEDGELMHIASVCRINHYYNKKITHIDRLYDARDKSFPTGFLNVVINKLKKIEDQGLYLINNRPSELKINIVDNRKYRTNACSYLRANMLMLPERRYNQVEVKNRIKDNPCGYLSSVTASGKSRYIIDIIDEKRVPFLIIVPTQALRNQIAKELGEVFGTARVVSEYRDQDKYNQLSQKNRFDKRATKSLERQGVDRFGDPIADNKVLSPEEELLDKKGYALINGRVVKVRKVGEENKGHPPIVVICAESIEKLPMNYVENVGGIIVDEGHRGSISSIRSLMLNAKNAMYRYSVSATPWRDRKEDLLLLVSSFGSVVIYDEPAVESISNKIVKGVRLIRKASPYPVIAGQTLYMRKDTDVLRVLASGYHCNESRNEMIINDAIDLVENQKRTVLICALETNHIELFKSRFAELGYEVFIYHSKLSKEVKIDVESKAKEQKKNRIFIATSALKEGVNTLGINAIILADVRKATNTLFQFIGRASRLEDGIDEALVYDYEDGFNVLTSKWSWERHRAFEEYYSKDTSFFEKKAKKAGVKLERV